MDIFGMLKRAACRVAINAADNMLDGALGGPDIDIDYQEIDPDDIKEKKPKFFACCFTGCFTIMVILCLFAILASFSKR